MREKEKFKDRLEQLRSALEEWAVDAVLIGSEANRRWLSGFTGSAGWLLVTAASAHLATDFRYWTQAEAQAPLFDLYRLRKDGRLPDLVRGLAVSTLAFEAEHMTVSRFNSLREEAGEEVSWTPRQATVEPQRQLKTALELQHMQAAAAITDRVMGQVNELARLGQTERELAWKLEKRLREEGADGVAFKPIVASGPNSALPHHQPGERELRAGDMLVVDMGAMVSGYHSDLTRSFYLGAEPPPRFWEIYELTHAAQQAAMSGIRPGLTNREADALARDTIEAAGHGDHFGHGLGHGVGLEIHESPHLSSVRPEMTLEEGMVTTLEPGVYIPGWGGVRIEDLVLLTAEGLRPLSHCPKQPLIV